MRLFFLLIPLIITILLAALWIWRSQTTSITVGQRTLLFTLRDEQDNNIILSDLLKKHSFVILIFYPRDNSFLCTKQLCQLRDLAAELPADIALVGISSNSSEEHRSFKQQYRLPFPLLSDPDNKVRHLYGGSAWALPARVTVVIDQTGTVKAVHDKLFSLAEHITLVRSLGKA